MSKRQPDERFIVDDPQGLFRVAASFGQLLERLDGARSLAELQVKRRLLICETVEAVLRATEQYDAFDVLESQKMRELAFGLVGFREQEHDGIPIAIEIAAILLLARGARSAAIAEGLNAGEPVALIHDEAQMHLSLGGILAAAEIAEAEARSDPTASLSGMLRATESAIRNRQYTSVREAHDAQLFGDSNVSSDMVQALGFGFEDFQVVRHAIHELGGQRLTAARDALAAMAQGSQDVKLGEEIGDQDREIFQKALDDLMLKPGKRAAFTAAEIADATNVSLAVVERILQTFAVNFEQTDPIKALTQYFDGDNPFVAASLVYDGTGNFLSLGAQLGDDSLRTVVERSLTGKAVERYSRARARMSETLTVGYFTTLIAPDSVHAGLKYYVPGNGGELQSVAQSAPDVRSSATQTELDALFIAEDVAICVEVKGKSLRQAGRSGHRVKLAADLKRVVGEAANQADRVRRLIETNGGLWTDSGWIDLSHIRETHCVAVALDDLGPAGIAMDELVRAGIVPDSRVPWVVSLHDLAVISKTIDHPAELLLYLRRRTEPDFAKVYSAVDELDLFMLFLLGNLYLDPDPDKVFAMNPARRVPTSRERKRYQQQLVPTQVGTQTDLLDLWIYALESGDTAAIAKAPKPTFNNPPGFGEFIASLADELRPARFRASADLLNLDGRTRAQILETITMLIERTQRDGAWHTVAQSVITGWGHFVLFIGSRPRNMAIEKATDTLGRYAAAKSYQLRADRELAIVVSESGSVDAVAYESRTWAEDPNLEALVQALKLVPPDRMAQTAPPPSARRATKQLRGRRK